MSCLLLFFLLFVGNFTYESYVCAFMSSYLFIYSYGRNDISTSDASGVFMSLFIHVFNKSSDKKSIENGV